MAEIVLINPRFEASYWGLEHALPLLGKRASVPPACLPLLAALTPDDLKNLSDEQLAALDARFVAGDSGLCPSLSAADLQNMSLEQLAALEGQLKAQIDASQDQRGKGTAVEQGAAR